MAIQEGPDSVQEKAVKKRWPVVVGTTAGTTRQTGSKRLHATMKSLIPKREEVGL